MFSPKLRKKLRKMWREATVLAVTALVCASTLAAVKLRHSRLITESAASLFAAPKAMHLPPPAATSPGEGPLVHASNLVYEGAFRLPAGTVNETSFAYGGTALAFNPTRQSLFIVGHDWQQRVAEIAIPDIRSSSSLRALATARVIQPFADATEGAMGKVGPNTVKIGGLLLFRDQLYLSAYLYYDGTGSQLLSHFITSPDLSVQGDVRGPYRVGTLGAGFVSGYFGAVPARWQAALGGPVLNGNCCLGVISRTSYGPALFAIDPQKIGGSEPAAATPLVYYPSKHPLAPGDTESPLFNLTSEVKGVIFHEGTRSVLFFGRHGLGKYCYGPGTADQKMAGQPADGGVDRWCFDPASESKGTHAYPYGYYVWAYDANELAAVKAGRVPPWEVKPYDAWQITLPFSSSGSAVLNGAAYDPATGRIFVSQAFGDGELPVIQVLVIRVP
ncbi:MAG: hypothetical protein DMG01_07560 [Acidobacteria bacterium]|nr:MAG: hypothetical protein DMG01_07560 [Acidobacteriota bacterium]